MGENMAFENDEERRAYFREYNKDWYQRHKERLLEKRRQHNEELRQWIRQYKSKLTASNAEKAIQHVLSFIIEIRKRRVSVLEVLSVERIRPLKDWKRKLANAKYFVVTAMPCGIGGKHTISTIGGDITFSRLVEQEKICRIRTKRKQKSIKKDGIKSTKK